MSYDFFDRRSAERFAELLDETNGSRRHHARGQADEQLAELVAIGHSLSAARSGIQVDPEFRMGLRAMLVATAERDGIGTTAVATEQDKTEQLKGGAEPIRTLFGRTGRRIRARSAIVLGVAACAVAVSGISAASESAAPGDALYGVKRSTERAQLAMAGSDDTRGRLSLTFARNRLAEAVAMEGDNPRFGKVLDDMDNDTRHGVRLLTSAAVARRDEAPLNSIDTFVGGQRRMINPELERLSASNRERALASMSLLDSVHQRTADLRAGLDCSTVTQSGSDAIGPKLRDCTTGASDSSGEPQQGQGQKEATTGGEAEVGAGKKATPQASDDPTVNPSLGGQPVSPSSGVPATTSDSPTPLISGVPVDPGADDDKGLLGGLLGGAFIG